jgi:DNA-binding GntR family transcriptional regulator
MTKNKTPPKIPRGTAPNVIYNNLKADILSGKLAGGYQLRQSEVAERFGISRIPVREALRQLDAEGLVSIQPRRGAVVSTISITEALEMLDIRLALDCRALRLAIPNMTDDDLDRAEQIIEVSEKSTDPAEWPDLNWQFHATLYAPADRPLLFEMIEQTFRKTARFMRIQVSKATGKVRPQAEHREILKACRIGDVEKAVKLLDGHISYAQKVFAATVRSRNFRLFDPSDEPDGEIHDDLK